MTFEQPEADRSQSPTATKRSDRLGTLNFRAVEPYPARGGRIRPNAIYRSGAFDDLTETGFDHMRQLGVTRVFDLRGEPEKRRRPSPLLTQPGFDVVTVSHKIHLGDLGAVLADPANSAEAAADVMTAIYANLPVAFTEVYRLYFRTAIDQGFPFAIHCTAGKDRTGVAVALLLDLLGVTRDDIYDDYLRTNAARDQLRSMFASRNQGVDFGHVAPHLIEPVIAAEAAYLDAMFRAIETDFGGAELYLRDVLGLSGQDLAQLKDQLVE